MRHKYMYVPKNSYPRKTSPKETLIQDKNLKDLIWGKHRHKNNLIWNILIWGNPPPPPADRLWSETNVLIRVKYRDKNMLRVIWNENLRDFNPRKIPKAF